MEDLSDVIDHLYFNIGYQQKRRPAFMYATDTPSTVRQLRPIAAKSGEAQERCLLLLEPCEI